MADTLLFRGGNTADINLAGTTVVDRELVIDTDTDEIVVGSNKKRTVMNGNDITIDSSGNVLVGKTASTGLTQGCELRPTGMGVFTRASANPMQVRRLTDDGDLVEFYQDSGLIGSVGVQGSSLTVGIAGQEKIRIDTSGNVKIIGSGNVSAPKIELNANGSINAAGSIVTASEVRSTRFGESTGIAAAADAAFRVGTAADFKAKIGYDGNATFNNQVISGTADQRGSFKAYSTGNSGSLCFLVQNPTDSTNNYFKVSGDGSAEFAGQITTNVNSGKFLEQYYQGTKVVQWDADGRLRIGGIVASAPNIELNTNGSASFGSEVTAPYTNLNYRKGRSGQVLGIYEGTNSDDATSPVFGVSNTGSITAVGDITASNITAFKTSLTTAMADASITTVAGLKTAINTAIALL